MLIVVDVNSKCMKCERMSALSEVLLSRDVDVRLRFNGDLGIQKCKSFQKSGQYCSIIRGIVNDSEVKRLGGFKL